MDDLVKLTGVLTLTLFAADGSILEQRDEKNLLTTVGKNYVAGAILAAASAPFIAMAIGTGTTAAAITDTTLQTESARAAFDSTTGPSAGAVSMVKTFGAGVGTGTITEAGILSNATSGGTLLSHVVFGAITKGSTDSLQITWTVTLS
jgi:hypothetical protein